MQVANVAELFKFMRNVSDLRANEKCAKSWSKSKCAKFFAPADPYYPPTCAALRPPNVHLAREHVAYSLQGCPVLF